MLQRSLFRLGLPTDKKAFMALVKTLRYRTEAPISDCSAALKEADGDLDAAVEVLRKRGAARAVKKGDRTTEHGFVVSCVGSTPASGAAVITVCCETDFAARNEHFQKTCVNVQSALRTLMDDTKGAILANPEEATAAVSEKTASELTAAIAVLGENMRVRSVTPLQIAPHVSENVVIGAYTHGTLSVPDVGRFVGLTALSVLTPEQGVPENATLTSVARHFVANVGDESSFQHQNFFGADNETVGKWLKRHGLKFSSSLVLEFGKEPVTHMAPQIPAQHQKKN